MKALTFSDASASTSAAELATRDQLCALQAAAWRADRESRKVDAALLRELWRALSAPALSGMAA